MGSYLVVTGSVGSGRVTFADARTGAVFAAEAGAYTRSDFSSLELF